MFLTIALRLSECMNSIFEILKGGWHEKLFFFFYCLFLKLGLSTVHIIFWRFLRNEFLQKTRLVFCIRCSSIRLGCGYVTSQGQDVPHIFRTHSVKSSLGMRLLENPHIQAHRLKSFILFFLLDYTFYFTTANAFMAGGA